MRRAFAVALALSLPAAAEEPHPSPEVSFAAVGDVMLTRSVARLIRKKQDPHYPFRRIQSALQGIDIVFGNLENPITPGPAVKPHAMVFRADPGVEEALRDAGFHILSLANNHIPDQGEAGVRDTLAALESVGLSQVGAGADDEQAALPTVLERNGMRVAFLAYNDAAMVPPHYGAQPGHFGTNLADRRRMKKAVAAAKQQADIVIVSMHHGQEYKKANLHQTRFAHAAIDAGADLVVGHHPHVLQEVERYKGRFIAYSLGNFVFDQNFSDAVREGAILKARFSREGLTSLQFVPFVLKRMGQPRLTSDPEIVARIQGRLAYPMSEDGTVDLSAPEAAPAAASAR